MSKNEWHFRIVGDEFDLSGVRDLFGDGKGDGVKIIKDTNDQTQLVMNLPFTSNESQAADNLAQEILAKMNGVARILYSDHENIRIGAIGCKGSEDGPVHQFIHMNASIKCRSRVSATGVVTNSDGSSAAIVPPRKLGDQWLDAADKDDHLARAFYLFGSLPVSWRGLYMVLEAAEDAHGGESGLISKKWVPDGQIKDFKATCNSYKALRLEARHGSLTNGIPAAKLTLDEAAVMVRTILERWSKLRVNGE